MGKGDTNGAESVWTGGRAFLAGLLVAGAVACLGVIGRAWRGGDRDRPLPQGARVMMKESATLLEVPGAERTGVSRLSPGDTVEVLHDHGDTTIPNRTIRVKVVEGSSPGKSGFVGRDSLGRVTRW